MKALRFTFVLLKIKQLFNYLVFWPLVVAIFCAFIQIIFSAYAIDNLTEKASDYITRKSENNSGSLIDKILYGEKDFKNDTKFIFKKRSVKEELGDNDLVIYVKDITKINIQELDFFSKDIFNKIYVVEEGDFNSIYLDQRFEKNHLTAVSFKGMLLAVKISSKKQLYLDSKIHQFKLDKEKLGELLGTISIKLPESTRLIKVNHLVYILVILLNVSFLLIGSVWLIINSHRRVIDYFSKSGALLPLVATVGKDVFYSSIWIITLIRGLSFLFIITPLSLILFSDFLPDDIVYQFYYGITNFSLWLVGLFTNFFLISIIISFSEIRSRFIKLAFMTKLIIVVLSGLGSIILLLNLLQVIGHASLDIISVIPIINLIPMILNPFIVIENYQLLISSVVSVFISYYIFKINRNWFGFHLEDL